jgi:hypothetical protein
MADPDDKLFEVETPLGFSVRVTKAYWKILTEQKHPILKDMQGLVEASLRDPDEIRRSRKDPAVYLFYRTLRSKRWVCAVAKSQDSKGFFITAYVAGAIKQGETLWSK